MAFAHLSTLLTIALSAAHVMSAPQRRAGTVTCADGNVTANEVCCQLFPVVDILQNNLFDGAECGEEAHSALRLTFHDAIGFSLNSNLGGGADGSILVFNATELQFAANVGIDEITSDQFPVFQMTNLTPGDFVHLAGAVGTANCPGAPQLDFFFGRPAPTEPAANNTVPLPTDNVTHIIDRFADAGFSVNEIVALLSSHTVAAADEIDTTIPGTPFDTTPFTFDTQFFVETLLVGTMFPGDGPNPGEVLSPIPGEMRLQSDFELARDSRTACLWQDMINNQEGMMSSFKAAMSKLQVLGQPSTLVDCSDVIPVPQAFTGQAVFPATFSQADIQQACDTEPFPTLQTLPGPETSVPPVPGS